MRIRPKFVGRFSHVIRKQGQNQGLRGEDPTPNYGRSLISAGQVIFLSYVGKLFSVTTRINQLSN